MFGCGAVFCLGVGFAGILPLDGIDVASGRKGGRFVYMMYH